MRDLGRTACLVGAALLGGVLGAAAEEPRAMPAYHESFSPAGLKDTAKVVSRISLNELAQLLTELGGAAQIGPDDSGRLLVGARFPNGLILLASVVRCQAETVTADTQCPRADVAALFHLAESAPIPIDIVNSWNTHMQEATVGKLSNGVVVRRSIVLDGGLTRGNIAANIMAFADSMGDFFLFAQSGASASAAPEAQATPAAAVRAVPSHADAPDYDAVSGHAFVNPW